MPMVLLLLTFFLLFFALSPNYVNARVIYADTASSSADVKVDQISHTVKIYDYGLVSINDTLKLSSIDGNGGLQSFLIGFPFNYSSNLDYCFAYNASNPNERFEVKLDVGLGGRIGFYGVNVTFPEPRESYNLTVVFVFSNLVSSENEAFFDVDFPMYPSLAQNASLCNVKVILPSKANCTLNPFEQRQLNFSTSTLDDSQVLKHTAFNLTSFQDEPALLKFSTMAYMFPLINVNEIKREITLDQWGGIHISDSYNVTNKAFGIASVIIRLPLEASFDPTNGARDEIGILPKNPLVQKGNITTPTKVTVQLRDALTKDKAVKFTVTYSLPWKKYVNQRNWRDYDLNFTFFEEFDWTIRKLEVSIILPEGAEFQSSKPLNQFSIDKSVVQETITFAFSNVTIFHDLDFSLTYRYLAFWASFYPTLWMGVLAIVVGAIALIWRAPKRPQIPTILVPPEDLKSFVEAYEGRTKILLELESMEEKLRKGRIPRRQYKVRKKMLESRVSTLSRDLTNLREKIRAAGGRYADNMRQIEVAETMLEGVETDILRVEGRYRRGEISKGAYGRLLEEYHRRRERALSTIDEVLLRFKEEIR
jgi:hypothetical protein